MCDPYQWNLRQIKNFSFEIIKQPLNQIARFKPLKTTTTLNCTLIYISSSSSTLLQERHRAYSHLLALYYTDHFTLYKDDYNDDDDDDDVKFGPHKVTNIDLKTSAPIGGRQVQIAEG